MNDGARRRRPRGAIPRLPSRMPDKLQPPSCPGPGCDERFLSKREIADRLGMSTRWIEQKHHDGLPSRLIGGRRRYLASEVRRWVDDSSA